MSTSAPSIAIIGAGIIGLSCAWELARRGANVAVYDRGAPGRAASHAAAGMLGAGYEAATQPGAHPQLYTLCARSAEMWREYARDLAQASGRDLGYSSGETLALPAPGGDVRTIHQITEHLAARDIAVEILSAAELQALEPSLSPSVQTAIRLPGDGQVDNRAVIPALIAACQKIGAEIVSDTPAQQVDTSQFDHTLWAIGASAQMQSLGISPVKGAAFSIKPGANLPERILRFGGHYIVPKRNRVIIGATAEPGVTDSAPDAGLIAGLRESAAAICPAVKAVDVLETWSGLRPATPDHGPLLGQLANGDFIATGHYRNGILLAPVTAQIMANLILEGEVDPLAAIFTPDRFVAAAP